MRFFTTDPRAATFLFGTLTMEITDYDHTTVRSDEDYYSALGRILEDPDNHAGSLSILGTLGFEDMLSTTKSRQLRERPMMQGNQEGAQMVAFGRLSRLVAPTPEHWNGEGEIELVLMDEGFMITITSQDGVAEHLIPKETLLSFATILNAAEEGTFVFLACPTEPDYGTMNGKQFAIILERFTKP